MKRFKLLIQTSANGYWAIVDEAGRPLMTASMVEFPTEKDVEKYLMPVAKAADLRYRKAMEEEDGRNTSGE